MRGLFQQDETPKCPVSFKAHDTAVDDYVSNLDEFSQL